MLQRKISTTGIVFYVSPLLAEAGVPHGFSTRIGGVSIAPFNSLNLGNPQGAPVQDEWERIHENYRRLQSVLGLGGLERCWVHQVHGGDVVFVREGHEFTNAGRADAILCDDPTRSVAIRVADCVPILVASQDGKAVAAIHAGWRGVVSGVVPNAMRELRRLSSNNFVAAVGPCIDQKAFEVGPEVLEQFEQLFGKDAPIDRNGSAEGNGKGHIDLRRAVKLQLMQAGLAEDRIDMTDRCTHRDGEEFYSHRRDKGLTGETGSLDRSAPMTGRRAILLVLIASTLATFWPAILHDFVIVDDPRWIAENPQLNPPSLQGIAYYWQHSMEGLYVPVTYIYWSLLARAGMHAAIFHGGSVVLHLMSAMVVFEILWLLIGREVAAGMGAMIFALHPLQVESVAWASGAKDLLAGLLGLIAIWQYLCFARDGARRHYAIAIGSLILAMLGKPSAIAAPLVAGSIDWTLLRKDGRAMLKSIWPMLLLTIPCIAWSRWVQVSYSAIETPLWTRPFIASDAVAFYLFKLIWPATLTVFYGRSPEWLMQSPAMYVTWIAPVGIALVVWSNRRRAAEGIAGFVAFMLGAMPVLGLTPFSFQLYSTVADHYVYVSMLGAAIAVAFALKHRGTFVLCGVVLAFLAVRSSFQLRHWRDSVTLMEHAAAVTPDSIHVQANLGRALARAGRVGDALPHFKLVVDAGPTNPFAHLDLARAYEAAEDWRQAEEHLRAAIMLGAGDPALGNELELVRRRLDSSTTNQ